MKVFTEFLKEEHANYYNGTDDNMPEAFEKWLSELSTDEWIDYGNRFALYHIIQIQNK